MLGNRNNFGLPWSPDYLAFTGETVTTLEQDDQDHQQDSLANYVTGQPTTWEVKRWTLQQAYLAQYAQTGRVYESAALAECSPQVVEFWQRVDSFGFQNRYAEAKQRFIEKREAEIDRRAFDGYDHPVIHLGVITDTYKAYSDNLAMFRLKKLDPSYRENAQLVDGLVEVVSVLDELRRIGTPRVVEALPVASEVEQTEE